MNKRLTLDCLLFSLCLAGCSAPQWSQVDVHAASELHAVPSVLVTQDQVSLIGDLDGDGVGEVMLSAVDLPDVQSPVGKTGGYVALFSGADLTPLWSVYGGSGGAEYGGSSISAGDLTEDGVADLLLLRRPAEAQSAWTVELWDIAKRELVRVKAVQVPEASRPRDQWRFQFVPVVNRAGDSVESPVSLQFTDGQSSYIASVDPLQSGWDWQALRAPAGQQIGLLVQVNAEPFGGSGDAWLSVQASLDGGTALDEHEVTFAVRELGSGRATSTSTVRLMGKPNLTQIKWIVKGTDVVCALPLLSSDGRSDRLALITLAKPANQAAALKSVAVPLPWSAINAWSVAYTQGQAQVALLTDEVFLRSVMLWESATDAWTKAPIAHDFELAVPGFSIVSEGSRASLLITSKGGFDNPPLLLRFDPVARKVLSVASIRAALLLGTKR